MTFRKPRFTSRAACGAALAALLPCLPSIAHAHGGIPRAFGIIFEPGNPQHIVLRSDVWGIFDSRDGGKTWNYGCSELYGAKWSQATHVSVIVTAGGRILVPNQNFIDSKPVGLSKSDDLCNWTNSTELAGKYVQEITQTGTDLYLITADGVNGGILGQMYKSSDKGDTWATVGKALPTDFSGNSIMLAPTDASRVYVVGEIIDTGGMTAIAEVSTDGGTTWTRPANQDDPATPQIKETTVGWIPRIYGVHPTRKDVIFAWTDNIEQVGQDLADGAWASGDGGKTWKKVFAGKGDLPGFTFSPDGTKVLIAGPLDGIQEATVDDALANGQSAFQQVTADKTWGLNWTSDGLYAGGMDFGVPTPFTFGVSQDEGKTFSPLMTVCDVKFAQCADNATMAMCMNSWTLPGATPGQGLYKEDYLEGDRCTGSSKGDGGVAPAAPGDGGGCAMSAPRRSTKAAAFGAVLAALGLVLLRRKAR